MFFDGFAVGEALGDEEEAGLDDDGAVEFEAEGDADVLSVADGAGGVPLGSEPSEDAPELAVGEVLGSAAARDDFLVQPPAPATSNETDSKAAARCTLPLCMTGTLADRRAPRRS